MNVGELLLIIVLLSGEIRMGELGEVLVGLGEGAGEGEGAGTVAVTAGEPVS